MYSKRIKIFVLLVALLLLGCLLRLTQMQLLSGSFYAGEVAKLKLERGRFRQLKTIRGRILDRKGRVIAVDEAQFQLCINYRLCSLLDGRVEQKNAGRQLQDRLEDLQQAIDKCARFRAVNPSEVRSDIRTINDFVWNRRAFQAWRLKFPDSQVLAEYGDIVSVPLSVALADFEEKEPDTIARRRLVNKVALAEMRRSWPLLQLETDDDIFTAQVESLDISDFGVSAKARRSYPYRSIAAQTIGWVGPAQTRDRRLFTDDRLSSYLEGEVSGRRPGVEYVCETVLRGRRGEEFYNIDRELVNRTETRFGRDVSLTLDIELQQKIENLIADCNLNPTNCEAPTAAVVIDVATGHILALVSMPVFDLNRARYDYTTLADNPNQPLRNRAINKQYPGGSVIKPLILIAGLESGKITPDEVISCPAQKASKHWPSCWVYIRYGSGHDYKGQNTARNALKWSCNRYFSRLADRIEPLVIQHWLFKFGYGREILFPPADILSNGPHRNFRQAHGQISTAPVPANATVSSFEQIRALEKGERRYFGMGQGNLRVTPLQVANAMAAIARGGVYKLPRLFIEDTNNSEIDSVDLNISPQTIALVHDGTSAVVNESGGTAYKEFEPVLGALAQQGIKVYGKTGSTEAPENAWFGGFATDSRGRGISIAVLVEGGQHGSSDAAPIARDIIQFAIEAGHIGQPQFAAE